MARDGGMAYVFTRSAWRWWAWSKSIDRVHGTRQDPSEAKARGVNLTGTKNQVLVTLVFDDGSVAASVKAGLDC